MARITSRDNQRFVSHGFCIAPDRHSAAAERVDSSSVLVAKVSHPHDVAHLPLVQRLRPYFRRVGADLTASAVTRMPAHHCPDGVPEHEVQELLKFK